MDWEDVIFVLGGFIAGVIFATAACLERLDR